MLLVLSEVLRDSQLQVLIRPRYQHGYDGVKIQARELCLASTISNHQQLGRKVMVWIVAHLLAQTVQPRQNSHYMEKSHSGLHARIRHVM